jgi:hypothetical protein
LLVCWRNVIAAWAVVLILALAAFGTVDLIPSINRAEASSPLRGMKIPQGVDLPRHDPFNLAPPAYEDDLINNRVDD